MEKPAVVIDCGTGYTKLGYAGGRTPSYTIPTAIASRDEIGTDTMRASDGIADLDFYTGDDALRHSSTYSVNYPIRHGLVENWNNMERLWQRCMFQHLGCTKLYRNSDRQWLSMPDSLERIRKGTIDFVNAIFGGNSPADNLREERTITYGRVACSNQCR
eukprot:gb/GECG01013203.1/.p1 GENE.gb/GECG01013203.1/~~gb/GECG01013203.1/.p1  ORF type:complete len:160 (+),score=12.58 gb/GECG01013203.1/:1-480(+)